MTDAYLGQTFNSRRAKLHRTPGCHYLRRCDGHRRVDSEDFPHHEWCLHCTGEHEIVGGVGEGHYESLLAAAEGGDG